MDSHQVDYAHIVSEQAQRAKKHLKNKRRTLIARDTKYFDSTELWNALPHKQNPLRPTNN